MDIIAKRVITLFDQSGKSDMELERSLNLPRSTINKWRNNKLKSYTKYINAIASYFDVSADYLSGRIDEPHAIKADPVIMTASVMGSVRMHTENRIKPKPTDEDIKFALFGGDEEITDEMYEDVRAYARFVKERKKKAGK